MNVNFTVFIDKILSGEKRQTIRRASQKWANVKAGDKLTLYTGLRTKECRKLGEAVVESNQTILLNPSFCGIKKFPLSGAYWLTDEEESILAKQDGFDNLDDFWAFFENHYGDNMGLFKVIRWADFKEAK